MNLRNGNKKSKKKHLSISATNLEAVTVPIDCVNKCDDAISGRADFDFLKHPSLANMEFGEYYDKVNFE